MSNTTPDRVAWTTLYVFPGQQCVACGRAIGTHAAYCAICHQLYHPACVCGHDCQQTEPPLIAGGQGRTAEDMAGSGLAAAVCFAIAAILIAAVVVSHVVSGGTTP